MRMYSKSSGSQPAISDKLLESDITIKITSTYVWPSHWKYTHYWPHTLWFIPNPTTVKFPLSGDQLALVMLSYLLVTPIADRDYHTTHGCLQLYDTDILTHTVHWLSHTHGLTNSFHKTFTRNLSIIAWTMRVLAIQGISIKNTKELAAAYGWSTRQSIFDPLCHFTWA